MRLGPYEILDAVGAGGMGEVYRARDTRLERTVAIKVLAAPVAADPEFRNRFEREARIVSQLNHPHICTVYDVGHEAASGARGGIEYLVLEYLEGETLARRLARGGSERSAFRLRSGTAPSGTERSPDTPAAPQKPLSVDEALRIAAQMCDALACAHGAGIVHRDLKPGNVFLVRGATGSATSAKLLDFGLAKAVAAAARAETVLRTAPVTMTTPLTTKGMILGTLQYMSPEQLEGLEADARSDIWAVGCVLYEMLTGVRAFEARSQAGLIAAILDGDPAPVPALDPPVPPGIGDVVRTCLAKDPADRFQSAHDLLLVLRLLPHTAAPIAAPPVRSRHRLVSALPWIVTATALGAGIALYSGRSPSAAPSAISFDVALPPDTKLRTDSHSPAIAISADGSRIAYVARHGRDQLYVRELGGVNALAVPGLVGDLKAPFFSPDGQWLGVFQDGVLKKVPVAGGAPVILCPAPSGHGGAWSAAGTIVFASTHTSALSQVSERGGAAQPLTTLDETAGEVGHYWPQFLPDQRTVLFTVTYGPRFDSSRIDAVRIDTRERRILLEGAYAPQWLGDGRLAFARGGRLLVVAFDPKALAVRGDPVPLLEGVRIDPFSPPEAAVSPAGTLAFLPGRPVSPEQRIVLLDRRGERSSIEGIEAASFADAPAFSPDGTKIAYTLGLDEPDVWVYDLGRKSGTRITRAGWNANPTWSPDGARIAFLASGTGAAYRIMVASAFGAGDPLVVADRIATPYLNIAYAPDGDSIYITQYNPRTLFDLWRIAADGRRPPEPVLVTPAYEYFPAPHPHRPWLAYVSNEASSNDIYVRSLDGSAKSRVSTDGGSAVVWSRDGRELFYRVGRRLMSVPVADGQTFQPGVPRVVLDLPGDKFDVAPNGSRFVSTQAPSIPPSTAIRVIVNWLPPRH